MVMVLTTTAVDTILAVVVEVVEVEAEAVVAEAVDAEEIPTIVFKKTNCMDKCKKKGG